MTTMTSTDNLGELRELLDKYRELITDVAEHSNNARYQVRNHPTQFTRSNINGYFGELEKELAAHLQTQVERAAKEARYMGAADFANWIVTHDESSFRQERAWFKIKPQLLLQYQADLMEGLGSVRTNIGLDPNAKVQQLAALNPSTSKQGEES